MPYRIRVKIDVEECAEGEAQEPTDLVEALDGAFEQAISEHQAESVDDVEEAVLRVQYAAVRTALARHFEGVAKKKLEQAEASCEPTPRRIESTGKPGAMSSRPTGPKTRRAKSSSTRPAKRSHL